VTWKAAASRRVPRPKARLADSRRAGGLREPPRAAKIWSRSSRPQSQRSAGTDAIQGQCDPRTFAEQRGTPSDACATGIRRSAARRFGICPGVLCRVPCTENCLTKRSSSGRTHREHEGRSDPRVPDRRWVSCRLLGENWQVKHDVAPEKCALPQKLVLYPLAWMTLSH
jgi:hypothetical protein